MTSVLLPLPDTPVTATNVPSGTRRFDVLQVVLPGADDLEGLPVAAPAALRHRDGPLAAQVCAGDRARLGEHRLDRTRWR